MAISHEFQDTIRERAQGDPEFRQALLREALGCIVDGELETGKAVLKDYIEASIGFRDLERRTEIPAKVLMRMLSPNSDPSAAHLANIIRALQEAEGVHFELSLKSGN
jgi:hypothetical protein